MMKNLQILLFILMSVGLSAQNLTLGPDVIEFDLDGTEDVKIGYILANNDNTPFSWYWDVEKSADFPSEWQVQVCDQLLCWSFGTERMPLSQGANVLGGGQETVPALHYVKVRPNGVAGKATVKFCVYNDDGFTEPTICTALSTSITSQNLDDINIYPNPANDYFQLTGDENIKSVEIYNIVGKQVMANRHTAGQSHDISDLKNGLYIARLINENGKLAKSMRLSKR